MIEVRNKLYIQRFFAESLSSGDLFKAVNYTQYKGDPVFPFWYKVIPSHTAHIDLRQDISTIFSNIKTGVRNEIRRAEKEGCYIDYNKDYESFVTMYNSFCEDKGIMDLKTNVHTLRKYDYILITTVKQCETLLCSHATLIDEKSKIAMLMYSCSPRFRDNVNRNLIGWGNRYLHYKEFELFKNMGLDTYEWNGVNINPNSLEKFSIGKFKLGFGGIEEDTFMLQTPLFVFMKKIQTIINFIRKK